MKVRELIQLLQEMNQDFHVYVPKKTDDDSEYQLVSKVDDMELGNLDDDSLEIPCCVIE